MGKISKSGIASGTSGSGNISLDNTIAPSMNSAIEKIKHDQQEHQDNMAKMLDEAGVEKYSKEKLLFVEKDKSGKVVFLEEGNVKSGYNHIYERHAKDFEVKHHIESAKLKEHLRNIIKDGQILSTKDRIVDNKIIGFDRIYLYKNKYYACAGISSNGFIVTMYPLGGGKHE